MLFYSIIFISNKNIVTIRFSTLQYENAKIVEKRPYMRIFIKNAQKTHIFEKHVSFVNPQLIVHFELFGLQYGSSKILVSFTIPIGNTFEKSPDFSISQKVFEIGHFY